MKKLSFKTFMLFYEIVVLAFSAAIVAGVLISYNNSL